MPKRKIKTLVAYANQRDIDTTAPLYPKERDAEVNRCKNEQSRREKHLAWKLLEKIVSEHLKLDFANLQFTKNDNGKWGCSDFHFSITHTDGLVCVAVSDLPIGVDAELVRGINEALCTRMLTKSEMNSFAQIEGERKNRYLLEMWVKKESIFKKGSGKMLMPNRIEASEHSADLRSVMLGGREYLISVASDYDDKIEFIYLEDL